MSGPAIFTARRMDGDGMSSLARWFDPAGKPLCWALEPGLLRLPHPIIPASTYPLRLRTIGDKHAKNLAEFGAEFHKGMVEIADVPGREAIEFHIGNTIADTLGCSLAGSDWRAPPANDPQRHWEVTGSRSAYITTYPKLRDAIMAGETHLLIVPRGQAGGQ